METSPKGRPGYGRVALFFLLLTGIALAARDAEIDPLDLDPAPVERRVVLDGLLGPIGMALLPDGGLLVAEEGTGARDASAGVTLLAADGARGRLVSGLPSTRDAGDLAGVPLVAVEPDGDGILIGSFGAGHLWRLPLERGPLEPPVEPVTPDALERVMTPLNRVQLQNPFDLAFDPDGRPVVSDASGNGVAMMTPEGTTQFIHRFDRLPNPARASDPVEAVPTGITREGEEYYVTLTGGCPYPDAAGRLVAIDEGRNERVVADGLTMPIDVARGADGTLWLLEFARFEEGASCFTGEGYLRETGRLSRRSADGSWEVVLADLDTPGALLPMPDGTLYISEVFPGRVIQVAPDGWPAPVAGAGLTMVDVAAEVGLDFQHGAFRDGLSEDPVAMMGGGLCWLDVENDGWLDLYLVNSHATAEREAWEADGGLPRNALFLNERGRFQDASDGSGADLALRGNGCIAADFNGDGLSDLYVTADGPDALLWNLGDGRFEEGAAAAGVATPGWSSAAAAGDLNGDGRLDLFVAGYIDLARKVEQPAGVFPGDFLAIPDRLYLNQGNDAAGRATFREVTLEAGLERVERALGALLSDLDRDGDLDLYIANDGQPNRLYVNQPDPESGFRLVERDGVAGDSGSGMGIASGDYDSDGWPDLVVTNWEAELNAVYRNLGAADAPLDFDYMTYRLGIAGLGNGLTGWGSALADFDLDSDLDLLVVNGRVPVSDLTTDPEPVRLYRNRSRAPDGTPGQPGRFLVWEGTGLDAVGPLLGRGSAVADYDNDGDLDVAINTIAGAARLLESRELATERLHWLVVAPDPPLPGTRVSVTLPDGRRLERELVVGSSYLASEDPRLHLGLGVARLVPEITVRWPDGTRVTLREVPADRIVPVARPEGGR